MTTDSLHLVIESPHGDNWESGTDIPLQTKHANFCQLTAGGFLFIPFLPHVVTVRF